MSIVFFDLDGTLVDEDGSLPVSAALTIRRLRENGHYCVVNTGRPFRDRDPALDVLDFDGYVCSCGQHLIFQGKTLLRDGFDRETSRLIAQVGYDCRLGMYFESEEGFWLENSFPPLAPNLQIAVDRLRRNGEIVGSPQADEHFCCDKLSISYTSNSRLQEFLTFIQSYCEIIDQGRRMYELPKRGYSKGSGCRKLAQLLHTPLEDCCAIGDSANDLSMLRCVGYPVAMGNAPAEVIAAAEYVTAPLREDGIYRAMTHLHLI